MSTPSTISSMTYAHAARSLAEAPRCSYCGRTLLLEKRLVGTHETKGQVFDYVGQCPYVSRQQQRGADTGHLHTVRVLGTARD